MYHKTSLKYGKCDYAALLLYSVGFLTDLSDSAIITATEQAIVTAMWYELRKCDFTNIDWSSTFTQAKFSIIDIHWMHISAENSQ